MEREQIQLKDKWDLSKMFKDEEEFEKSLKDVDILLKEVLKCKNHIMDNKESLLNFYQSYEKMERLLDKVIIYSRLLYDTDTTNSHYQSLKLKTDKISEKISNELSFIAPEMLKVDYQEVLNMIKDDERFNEYLFDLESMFRYQKHTLSEREEEIITRASNALGTGSEVFNNLDNTDINLGMIKDEEGNLVELTNSNYNRYMMSKDRNVRIDAFNHMYTYFKNLKNSLSSCLKGTIKEDFFISEIKKFNSPLHMSLYQDNIDVSVYKNLIDVVHKNLDVMYDYMSVRKKALGLDEMHMYDIYVDLVKLNNQDYDFEKGKEIVINALKPLGEEYINDLKKAFDERWIDIYPNKGKKSGAYSWGCYDSYPYLLLNYDNTMDSVSTLAHELGHSMHSYYSNKQTYINHAYPIFLAEIASTVNEVLLNEYLYKNAKTKEEKIAYLTEFLDKVRTTVYRQTMFAEFEMLMHDKEEKEIPLTEEEFSNTYYELNKLYYGDNVISDDNIRYEWARIPHFYTPFYTYKYATGLSIAIAISSDILNGNDTTRKKYLKFLSSGGSNYPLEILKEVGIDLNENTVYDKMIAVFKEKLEALKELL